MGHTAAVTHVILSKSIAAKLSLKFYRVGKTTVYKTTTNIQTIMNWTRNCRTWETSYLIISEMLHWHRVLSYMNELLWSWHLFIVYLFHRIASTFLHFPQIWTIFLPSIVCLRVSLQFSIKQRGELSCYWKAYGNEGKTTLMLKNIKWLRLRRFHRMCVNLFPLFVRTGVCVCVCVCSSLFAKHF